MNLTRRQFTIGASALAVSPSIILLTGCTYTKADLIADAGIVDNTVAAILTALGQTALATEIQSYLTQFDQAVNSWQGGSTSAVIISICQDLEMALGDTGMPIAIVAAADAAISGLELLVQNLGGNAVSPVAVAAIRPSVALASRSSVRTPKPVAAKSRKAAVHGWNVAIVGTPLALHTLHEPLL